MAQVLRDELRRGAMRSLFSRATRTRFRMALATVMLAVAPVAPDVAAANAHDYRDTHFDYFVTGDPGAPRAARTEFGLILMGGGGNVAAAFRVLAERAGHGHVVILRAVSDDSFDPADAGYGQSFASDWGPVTSAQTVVFHDRQAADDPRVVAALRGADGIFLAGGDQANYVRYWKGTAVERVLNAHVAAGRPIGGSSAGLAILGHYSYTALDGGSLESAVALADPYGAAVTLETDFLKFPGLERVITDSHFSARCRLGRLITFVARLTVQRHEAIIGLGLDERSALVVDRDGHGRLVAGSAGSAWAVTAPVPPTVLAAGHALAIRAVRIDRLDAGSDLDTRSGAVRRPAERATVSVSAGSATGEAFALRILTRAAAPPGET